MGMDAKSAAGYGIGYSAAVGLIMDAEKGTKASTPSVLDIRPIIETAEEQNKKFTYLDLLQTIDSIISNKQKGSVKEGSTVVQQHIITSGVAQTQLSTAVVGYPGEANTAAASEYDPEEMLKPIDLPKFKYMSAKKVDVDQMVLPGLSMSDQIAELERIIEGVRENIFDAEHFEIVMEEVYSLVKAVNDRKKKIKKSGAQASALEQSLWLMRDKRLHEAINAINNMNG